MTIAAYKTIGNVRKALIGLLLVGASCVSSQASAALVLFTLTGPAPASFTLDQSPTPSSVTPNYFVMTNVVGTFLGAPSSHINLTFNDNGHWNIGIFNFDGPKIVDFFGSNAPLFSGTTATPTFNLGTYSFEGAFSSALNLTGGGSTLSITSVPGGVPEPSTWMMMVAGFGLLGGAMRYGNNARAGAKTASLT